ncbi:MAG: magnesium transporter [Bacteroidales bacterium]|nr:MAG: magnesium transporter [Bacteroidales bacterium]
MPFELTREYIEQLKEAVKSEDEKTAQKMIVDLHPADIAEVFGEISNEEAKFLYILLDGEKAADVLIEMEEDDRENFLKILPGELIAKRLIDKMESDDAADVIGVLSEQKQEEILQSIGDVEQAGDIVDLLSYDEDTAGGLMAKELVMVNENWDMNKCMREIRKQAAEIDELYYVYVVDNEDILKGTLSLKRLLVSRANAKIKNICNADVISVRTDTKSEEVANIMDKYDLVSLPVVDTIGRLIGRITIDDVVDVIREEAEKDYQLISGITQDVEPTDNALLLTRARLPWLLIGLLGGILGAQVISMFEENLKIDPKIALFFPLIAAMGGNVGVQSSSIVVQGIAAKIIDLTSTARKLLKEISVALINGIILSSLCFVYNIVFKTSFELTITVSTALLAVIIFASVFGTFVPLALNKFKIDPALATGPFITTINDIMGLLIYLGIGRLFYDIF